MKDIQVFVPREVVEQKIYLIRGQNVMLDSDLAQLYGVTTFNLNKAVKRNLLRFPEDFMFQLKKEEFDSLRFHFGMSKIGRGGRRYIPYVFTEQGIAMLSSVLKSERAVLVNIGIMRTFVKLRRLLSTHKDLAAKLEDLEKKYDAQFRVVFEAIRQIMTPLEQPKKEIGFRVKETKAQYKAKR